MPAFDLALPKHVGLTHVIDKGLGPRAWEDILEVAGDHISIVKLGWGTAYVTQNLERKLEVLRDKPVVFGGTFFEVVYAKNKLDEYKQWLSELGLTHVEISDGTVEIQTLVPGWFGLVADTTPPAAPAVTLVEVSKLYGPDFLIEIEAIAAA